MNMDEPFDGNQSTFQTIKTANVQLGGIFIVSAMTLHVLRGDSPHLTIKDSGNRICYSAVPSTTTIYFDRVFKTKSLSMYFSKEVTIKEIEVFGGKNIALWKATEQSTTLNEAYTSDKAVDGLGNGDDINTCSHTSELPSPPTWNVSLGNNFSVTSMYIVNRKDFGEYNSNYYTPRLNDQFCMSVRERACL
ncbi:uncharacterized protein LOC134277452 [Saccostrea cucullata]|uniref:uncharacterized protein LOC134277452 n=1 Tax=Saccostrea cuccullata TaxID=36930 RepID=UPI002ECFB089